MIDVIIPTYNSSKSIIRTLYSIMEQSIADKVCVYIVDDASNEDYQDVYQLFSKYLSIHLLRLEENSGPGVARRYGIEQSDSEYIVFIDSDDTFYDKYSLENLYYGIEGYDMSFAKIYYEKIDETCYHECCLHGKMYRRSFLEKNSIQFGPFRSHEDNSFNQICLSVANIHYIDDVVYYYYDTVSSITNNEDIITSMNNYIDAMTWACRKINTLDNTSNYNVATFILSSVLYCYFNYLAYPNLYEFVFDKMSYMKQFYFDNISYLSKEDYQRIYNNYQYDVDKFITIDEFLSKIKP